MATTVSLQEIFETYNAKESYLPYFVPLMFWASTYFYCEIKMPETKYRNWFEIPNIHHIICILYGMFFFLFLLEQTKQNCILLLPI